MSESQWMHKAMAYIACGVLLIAMLLHELNPGDQLYVLVATTALGFLFGKATNGIGRKPKEDGEQ